MSRTAQLVPKVIVEFCSQCFAMTPAEADAVVPTLIRMAAAERVQYDWQAKLYKPRPIDPYTSVVSIKPYSVEEQQRSAAAAAMDASST